MNATNSVHYESAASRTIRTLEYLLQKHAYLLDQNHASAPLVKSEEHVTRCLSDQDKATIIALFQSSTPPMEIAKRINFSCAAVTKFLHKAGLREMNKQTKRQPVTA